MKVRGVVLTAVATCAIGWFGRSVFSEDAPGGAPKIDQEAMMKLAQPGEEHARLAKAFVGDWNSHIKFTMQGQEMESDSTSSITSFMGGRFLMNEVKGSTPMGPFEGRGILGYNNGTKQFVTFWIDSMGTGTMNGTGVENEKGKSWTFTSSYDAGPFKMTSKETWKVVSDDEFTISMDMGEHGKGELTCKRKK
jgi:hypothetical protein